MRWLLDEMLPRAATDALERFSHDAVSVARIRRAARGLVGAAMVASMIAAAPSSAHAQQDAFSDVTEGVHKPAIDILAETGLFEGTLCGGRMFCPGEPIKRSDMAVWIVRALDGKDPAAVSGTRFDDVDASGFHGPFIERMAELEVTRGCGDGTGFCPDRNVTRAQMAVFLSRAYRLPEAPDPGFADVPADAWYAADVARLAASKITVGCGDGAGFCPGQDTTRGQMATFLHRAEKRSGAVPARTNEPAAREALSQILPWYSDPPYPLAVVPIVEVWLRDPDFGRDLAGAPWITDGIERFDDDAVYGLGLLYDHDPALARRLLAYASEQPAQSRNTLFLGSLHSMMLDRRDEFELLIAQPWFTDGLDATERAFIVAVEKTTGLAEIYEDLLTAPRIMQSRTVSLPLAGEVDLWVFFNDDSHLDQDILAAVERGARGTERLMGVPFPLTDLIVMSLDVESCDLVACGGVNYVDSMVLVESGGRFVGERTLYHEIAHFYLTAEIGPFWLYEGGANLFAEHVIAHAERDGELWRDEQALPTCRENGVPNLHALNDPDHPDPVWQQTCGYGLGQFFLTSLFDAMGEAAFSSALRELHGLYLDYQYYPTEEQVYRIFLKHTPPDREAAFRELYRTIHGGPFLDG